MTDDEEKCNFFTHYSDSGSCLAFNHCQEFSPDTCQDCVSGPRHCEEEAMCSLPGQVKKITYMYIRVKVHF